MATLQEVVEELIDKTNKNELIWYTLPGHDYWATGGDCAFDVYMDANDCMNLTVSWNNNNRYYHHKLGEGEDISPLAKLLQNKYPPKNFTLEDALETSLKFLQYNDKINKYVPGQ